MSHNTSKKLSETRSDDLDSVQALTNSTTEKTPYSDNIGNNREIVTPYYLSPG